MPNFRILHEGNTRDIHRALAVRDRTSEASVLEQLLACGVWRPMNGDKPAGALYWYCDRAGSITLDRSGSIGKHAIIFAGPLPEPLQSFPITELPLTGSYNISIRADRAIRAMKASDCNINGFVRQLLRALHPSTNAPAVGWCFNRNATPYFHSSLEINPESPPIPPPVAFSPCI